MTTPSIFRYNVTDFPTRWSRMPRLHWLLPVLIIVMTVWGYYDTLDNFFIMDDFDMIRGHSTFSQFLRHWYSPVGGNMYRPLIDLLFIWDFYWWEWNPMGWHITDMLFHLFNSLLVYGLAKRLTRNLYAGFVAGLLFGLHTCHTEAVTWISARMDVVCTTFFLLSVYEFLTYSESTRRRAYWLSVLCFTCALFVKEMAVTLPVVLILYELIFSLHWKRIREELRRLCLLFLPYFFVLSAYFSLRFVILRGVGGHVPHWFGLFILENLVLYWKFLTIPFTEQIFSSSLWLNLTGLGIFTGVCLVISKYSRFAIGWIYLTLLPVYMLHIGRGVYLASVGFCVLAGLLFTFDLKRLPQISFATTRILCRKDKRPGGGTPILPTRHPCRFMLSGEHFAHGDSPLDKGFRIGLRVVQLLLFAIVLYQYMLALDRSNAWWSDIAAINEQIPLKAKALYPEFPEDTKVCLQDVPLISNQRFHHAFLFRYPHSPANVYVEDFERCARHATAREINNEYLFLYYRQQVLYDFTYETRERLASGRQINVQKLPPGPEYLMSQKHPVVSFALSFKTQCVSLGLVSSLANGIDVSQGTIVTHGRIEGDKGEQKTFRLIAGQNTAEWAFSFSDIRQRVRHDLPQQVYRRWTVQRSEDVIEVAQNYLHLVRFDAPFAPARLILKFVPPPVTNNLEVALDRIICYE